MTGVIEWYGPSPDRSNMSMSVLDPLGRGPTNVIDEDQNFTVELTWTVPAPEAQTLGGEFRLRVFAESIGPGQEKQIGATVTVPVAPVATGDKVYVHPIAIPANTLDGEGTTGGVNTSGCFKVAAVLQHINGTVFTDVSGYAELDGLLYVRRP